MSLTPPRPAPPPLNALRAFEAALRHESFQRAADELAVTPGAIAQQVRKLEDWAGLRLFDRNAQGVTPTAPARAVMTRLSTAFEDLTNVARTLRQSTARVPVRIAALPAIAQLWLAPRLTALRSVLPGAELSIHALDTPPSLIHGSFDIAIYPAWEPMADSVSVAANVLGPVAAPDLAKHIRTPGDLINATLIHDSAWHQDWAYWLNRALVTTVDAARGPVFSLYSLAVDRCVAGEGVLIGHSALIGDHLAHGRLVQLFPDLTVEGPKICLSLPQGAQPGGLFGDVTKFLRTLDGGIYRP